MSYGQPRLDDRHRDADGTISRKHGNTRVATLRETHGEGFAAGHRGDMHLSTLLEREGVDTLSELLRKN